MSGGRWFAARPENLRERLQQIRLQDWFNQIGSYSKLSAPRAIARCPPDVNMTVTKPASSGIF